MARPGSWLCFTTACRGRALIFLTTKNRTSTTSSQTRTIFTVPVREPDRCLGSFGGRCSHSRVARTSLGLEVAFLRCSRYQSRSWMLITRAYRSRFGSAWWSRPLRTAPPHWSVPFCAPPTPARRTSPTAARCAIEGMTGHARQASANNRRGLEDRAQFGHSTPMFKRTQRLKRRATT